jgi:hypothetical protein
LRGWRDRDELAPAGAATHRRASTAADAEVLSFYGVETILLVGGSLLEAGDVIRQTTAFVDEVARVSRELAS